MHWAALCWLRTRRVAGPIVVEAVSGQQYRCLDMSTGRSSDFHVSRLKEFVKQEGVNLAELAMLDHDMYVAEAIVDHRGTNSGKVSNLEFKLRWSGYEEADDSWVPWKDCRQLELLPLYLQANPSDVRYRRHLPKAAVEQLEQMKD